MDIEQEETALMSKNVLQRFKTNGKLWEHWSFSQLLFGERVYCRVKVGWTFEPPPLFHLRVVADIETLTKVQSWNTPQLTCFVKPKVLTITEECQPTVIATPLRGMG